MSSLGARARTWVGSVQFAVTAGSVLVAVGIWVSLLEAGVHGDDAMFAMLLAAVAVPNIYREQWNRAYEDRFTAVAWAAVAGIALATCHVALATGLRDIAGGTTASIAAFVVAWFVGIFGARAITGIDTGE